MFIKPSTTSSVKYCSPTRIFTIPSMGYYSEIFVDILRELGLYVTYPTIISNETNRLGVRNSATMMCWPYRATLGSLIETLKKSTYDITDIITYSTESQCRFRHYGNLYALALQSLGYKVSVHIIRKGHILRDLKKITGGVSYFRIWKAFNHAIERIKNFESYLDKKHIKNSNILLIGEIYTLLEPHLNLHIRNELNKLGIGSILPVNLSTFIGSHVKHGKKLYSPKIEKEAEKYIDRHVGGHGFENICHILNFRHKVSGVIHMLPMTCAPECLVIPIIDHICQKDKLPLLRLEIDDNISPLNVITRLEAFVDAILTKNSIGG